MKVIVKTLDLLVDGSLIVALSVYSLTYITLLSFDLGYDSDLLLFSFFGTIFGYNFIKYLDEFKVRRGKFESAKFQLILFLSVISLILSGFYFLALDERTKTTLMIPLAITVLYTLPIGNKTLRTLAGFKIYVITFSWAFITVVTPLIRQDYNFSINVVLHFIQILLFIFAIMVPFEIRDMDTDDIRLKTIPQRIGVKKSKVIAGFLLLVQLGLEFMKEKQNPKQIIVLGLIVVITLFLIVVTKKNQHKYYSSILIESLPVFWLLLLLYG
ncbi:MAG: hypothetical protein HRT68_04520 [Flavobacteriaceae bacterium]|nr:hypothetical protein [Flavobacteriaceae bacterium]